SATPVATTQIDLAWSSSTDNFVVAGYVVYRDLVPVATTSLTSYSDTGLIASTTYDYMVQAFDTSLNYSSTSNELSATTLEPPPPPPTPVIPEPPEATIARVVVDELMVVPGVSTTSIELVTARPARIELRWGRTASYELGYVVGGAYTVDHAILLTDLEPGTTYEYEIIGFTPYGSQSVLRTGSFTTLWHFPIDPPANVNRFSALAVGDDVRLSWVMPETKNLSYVRVVRSHLGFPLHPQDGAIVYQGLQEAFVDEFILSQYSPVYYTAFMYDVQGNVSSGAVAYVYAVGGAGYAGAVPGGSGASLLVQEATTSIMQERVTVDMHMPDASEIAITQGVRVFTMADDDMLLHSQSPFTITIPVATVAGNLKSIIATITDPTDHRQTYAYLLRINHDRTAYEAIVTPL
ncbi:hypothetical protein KC906_03020, partial [Candidatus Kaiserbacteria bacterium]|nr:hypothetical protein [Candidatus Kaiserbacteria bacterium]